MPIGRSFGALVALLGCCALAQAQTNSSYQFPTTSPQTPQLNQGGQILAPYQYYWNQGGGGFTSADTFAAEAPFDAVRVCYANPFNISGVVGPVAVSPSSSFNNGYTPQNSSGTNDWSQFVYLTFNNGGVVLPGMENYAAPVTAATISAGGTGGTNGNATVTVAGAILDTGGTAPQISVTISGGAITAVNSIANAGSKVLSLPANPVQVTGSGLSGAELNLTTTNVTTLTVPANTYVPSPAYTSWTQGLVCSDVVPVQSIARLDGGPGTLLFTRTLGVSGNLGAPRSSYSTVLSANIATAGSGYLSGGTGDIIVSVQGGTTDSSFANVGAQVSVHVVNGVPVSVNNVSTPAAYTALPSSPAATAPLAGGGGTGLTLNLTTGLFTRAAFGINREWFSTFDSGDFVSNLADLEAFNPPSGNATLGYVAFVQFFYRGRAGATVMGFGDSLMQGYNTPGYSTPFGLRASILVSSQTRPVTWANFGKSGETTDYALWNAQQAVPLFKPQIVIVESWSANDGCTAQTAATGWARAMQEVALVQQYGGVPIVIGPEPEPSFCTTPSADATRTAVDAWGAQYAAAGGYWLQVDNIVGDTADPQRILPLYDAGDGVHWNAAGHQAVAGALAPIIKRILGN